MAITGVSNYNSAYESTYGSMADGTCHVGVQTHSRFIYSPDASGRRQGRGVYGCAGKRRKTMS